MQIYVGQDGDRQQSYQAQPVCADLDGAGFCGVGGSDLFELPKSATRLETLDEPGFDKGLVLEAGSLEIMSSDSSNLASAWSGSRPGDELLTLGDESKAELGFKSFDRSPISSEGSQRIDDFNAIVVELDARVDEEGPDRDVNGADGQEKSRQLVPNFSHQGGNDSQKSYEAGTDAGIEGDLWSNRVHESNLISTSTKDARGN